MEFCPQYFIWASPLTMCFTIILCGMIISQFSCVVTSPIIEGSSVKIGRKHGSSKVFTTDHFDFPFVVYIEVVEVTRNALCQSKRQCNICGGVIIRRGAVLTAAHCLTWPTTDPEVSIYAGISHIQNDICKAQHTTMRDYVIHKSYIDQQEYNSEKKDYQRNDIAIIWLKTFLDYDMRVNQATLSTSHNKIENKIGFALGWGKSGSSEYPDDLQKGEMRVMKQSSCTEKLPGITYTEGMLCTLSDSKKTIPCSGDSGGPFVIDNKVVGVMSFISMSHVTLADGSIQDICNPQKPAVFTNVGKYERWIAEHLLLGAASDTEKNSKRSSANRKT